MKKQGKLYDTMFTIEEDNVWYEFDNDFQFYYGQIPWNICVRNSI